MDAHVSATLEILLEKNEEFIKAYQASALLQLVTSKKMAKKECRIRMLDLIQILSNFFQKSVLLRSALSEHPLFSALALQHLKEEFCHQEQLMAERGFRPPAWDPVVEATCSWFAWKMFSTNDEEKVVLIHLVLETSAAVFFQEAHKVMPQYGSMEYFKVHAKADEEHEKMGKELLQNLSSGQYKRLLEIQYQGWNMMYAACDRIAALSSLNNRT